MPKITEYPSITTIDASTVLLADGNSGTGIILASDLAKYAVEEYAESTLGGSLQSVQDVIDAQQASLTGYFDNGNIDDLHGDSDCGSYWLNCDSTTITGTKPSTAGQGLLIVKKQSSDLVRQVYIPITSGYDLVARYYRVSTSTWTDWSDPTITQRLRGLVWRNITTGSSLSDLTDTVDSYFEKTQASHISGYIDSSRSSAFGLPAAAHYFDVYAYSATYKMVVARTINGGAAFQLTKLNGTWSSEWQPVFPGSSSTKTLTAADNLVSLAPGMYRLNNAVPIGAPDTTYKYGYVYIDHRGDGGYTYYEYAVGDGSGTDFRKYYGWKYSNSATSITWIKDDVKLSGPAETSTGNTDINDYTTPGTYFFNSSVKPANNPDNTGYFRLVVTAPVGLLTGTNRVRHQEALTSQGIIFTRLLNSSDAGVTWTAGNWTKLRSSSWAILGDTRVSTALTTYIDSLTPGVYYLHSATADATTVGAPTGAWYFYEIRKHGPEHVVVIATRGSTNGKPFIYQKCKYGPTWDSEWQLLPTRSEVDSILKSYKVGGSTPDVDDCNSLPRNSIGYTYASALNSPDSGYQIFTYGINDSNKVQLALRGTVNPKIKTRLMTGGNWSAWVESAKQTDVDELNSNLNVKNGSIIFEPDFQNAGNVLTIKQSGNVVTINGYIENATFQASVTSRIGKIMGVSYPSQPIRVRAACGSNAYTPGANAFMGLTKDGMLTIYPASAGTTCYFSMSYII